MPQKISAMNPTQPPLTFYSVSQLSGTPPCITLVVALGVLYQNLTEYLTGIDSQTLARFAPFDNALSQAVNPDALILLLGPHLNLVNPSIEPSLLRLFSTFTALGNVEILIHLSVWSTRLADRLPALPTSVRKAIYLVSNLRRADRELVRVCYDATIETFTVSFSATLPGISLTLKGRLPNLSFMFALHLALAKMTFTRNCVTRLEIQAANEVCLVLLRVSGSMRDARKILEALGALAQKHAFRKYMVYSLDTKAPMLYQRDELEHFIHALVFNAPCLHTLTMLVNATHPAETMRWIDGIRLLAGIRSLVHIDIIHPRPLGLLDADITRFLQKWQHAAHVSLNPKPMLNLAPNQSSLTRNVFKTISSSAPPSLRHLGLYLDAEKLSVIGSGIQPQTEITEVEIGMASLNSEQTIEVLEIAERVFPNASVSRV